MSWYSQAAWELQVSCTLSAGDAKLLGDQDLHGLAAPRAM
jgi:hypothetical protein